MFPAVLLIGCLVVGAVGGPYEGRLDEVQRNDNAAWPPASAESTQVAEIQKRFTDTEMLPAIAVYERPGGVTLADTAAVATRARAVAAILVVVFVVLALLLRALVAPVLLIATVVLSFAATIGVWALVFNHVFDIPRAAFLVGFGCSSTPSWCARCWYRRSPWTSAPASGGPPGWISREWQMAFWHHLPLTTQP
jgi:uncharacterized membrane protein YdfJ with MMPL/SSD domain